MPPNNRGPKGVEGNSGFIGKREAAPEQYPTREEVFAVLMNSLERIPLRVHRDIRDEGGGLVLLEVRQDNSPPGESVEYLYIREGVHMIRVGGEEKRIASKTNNIDVAYYKEGVPVGGTTYAVYDGSTRRWRVLP